MAQKTHGIATVSLTKMNQIVGKGSFKVIFLGESDLDYSWTEFLNPSFCAVMQKNHSCFEVLHMHAHHGGLVIAVEDVDKIRNGQHTCDKQDLLKEGKNCNCGPNVFQPYPQTPVTCRPIKGQPSSHLPPVQKRLFSPVEASEITPTDLWAGGKGLEVYVGMDVWAPLTWSWVSKMTSLQLTGMAS